MPDKASADWALASDYMHCNGDNPVIKVNSYNHTKNFISMGFVSQ
ncbi:MAG: hypothetical protein R2685_03485 [Candidatus Nitrosocosmicus sp.]|jgi:hypothetical protein